jgi:hypothetical protein
MSSEASARLVSKLIILLCLIFTLCQLGSELKSGCIAQKWPDNYTELTAGKWMPEEEGIYHQTILIYFY